MNPIVRRIASVFALALCVTQLTNTAYALDLRFEKIADGVFAYVGDTGARSVSNEGLNANIGLVLTQSGAVLIDSGATFVSAKQIHEAAKRVSTHPIRWVINTGGQDHRWLGNGYFAAQGAQIIAHAKAKADMQNRGADHLASLRQTLGSKADGTTPTLPTLWLNGSDESLVLDGVRFNIKYRGGAHTPGDILVHLPTPNVLFSGDVVYVTRMLGVIPVSNTRNWLASFAEIEALAPALIVPGHGVITNLSQAQADTKTYLTRLREHMKKAVDDGVDISAAVRSFPSQQFAYLLNSAELMPGNGSRTYLEIERE